MPSQETAPNNILESSHNSDLATSTRDNDQTRNVSTSHTRQLKTGEIVMEFIARLVTIPLYVGFISGTVCALLGIVGCAIALANNSNAPFAIPFLAFALGFVGGVGIALIVGIVILVSFFEES